MGIGGQCGSMLVLCSFEFLQFSSVELQYSFSVVLLLSLLLLKKELPCCCGLFHIFY